MARRDKKGVDILLATYWSSEGWREPPTTAPGHFLYAKAAGLMFDGPISRTHDEIVKSVVEAASGLTPADAANAFLASLTTRHLDLRSVLGSYAVARHLVEHELVPAEEDHTGTKRRCAVCDLWDVELDIDLNVLNFERYSGAAFDEMT